ncbi:MAG: adenylosuccinate lyase [Patescibacteria group bacterium]|nr:adenylosuccinate lyase [Patescibacteria group bacterium]
MDPLDAISPIDGRYRKYTEPLAAYFSEAASMKYKIIMEGEYLIALSESRATKLRAFSKKEKKVIRSLYDFTEADAKIIKDIEFVGYKKIKPTNHDFKAIEYFIKDKLQKTSLKDCAEWVHFGLTSYDASDIAYALMIGESVQEVYIPAVEAVIAKIGAFAKGNASVPMLARTHGQPASPTTFGKEFKVFEMRLRQQLAQIKNHTLFAKLNGATGNYNALVAAYPKKDWITFSKKFIATLKNTRKVKIEANIFTTQIESRDSFVELFQNMQRIHSILIGFNQDVWRYISDGWIAQKSVEGEVGSSTMPHKINPWFLENSEGNFGMANAMLGFFSQKLPISRLQRDLSDSTVMRTIGVAFGHSLIGFAYLINQLGRIAVHKEKAVAELERHPEVITEAIQTILRRENVPMPYERLKTLARGKEVTINDIRGFIDELDISQKLKKELKKFIPKTYIGLAAKLAKFKG